MSLLPWWREGDAKKRPRERLPELIPTPGSGSHHVLPYSRIGDDWGKIEQIQQLGGRQALYKGICAGCGTSTQFIVPDVSLFDPTIYWLCETCQTDGFAWGSTLGQDQIKNEFQFVRQFPNDSLWRHKRFSPNFKDAQHRPVDSVEELARSLTKGYKPRLK